VLGNESKETAVIRQIGAKAREVAMHQYDDAIGMYKNLLTDDSQLAGFVLKQAVQLLKGKEHLDDKDKAALRQTLFNMFNLSQHSQSASAWTVQSAITTLINGIQGLHSGQEDRVYELIGNFMRTQPFEDLKAGVASRLAELEDARKDINEMSDEKAAFKLTAKFPSVRQEVFSHFGFKLDPTQGVPPMDDGAAVKARIAKGDFSSPPKRFSSSRPKPGATGKPPRRSERPWRSSASPSGSACCRAVSPLPG
jgi:hypothetical protein